ncbi:MAG: class I SAM-dependent methyltransferase [Candidatus Limnocylindria bacterium]
MAPTAAQRFSATAAAYAATMAPSLRPIAREVVRRARLERDERVLDLGTGTGIAAAAAIGEGRRVTGIDAAPGMLEIARREVPGATFHEMDFGALDLEDATHDVAIAVHSLLFATDQAAVLREWLRVTRRGGRLSLSVPGPTDLTPTAIYAEIYRRYGIDTSGRYPTAGALAANVADAGWENVETAVDGSTAIILADVDAFRTWREMGSRGAQTAELTPMEHGALTEEMLAGTPRDVGGRLRIPFGTIYLTAVKE